MLPKGEDVTEAGFIGWLKANQSTVRTPAYIYSEELLSAAVAALRSLFPAGTRLFYSLKANPQPEIVRRLACHGVCGEVASLGEYRMCRLAGLRPSDILVGGVSKSVDYLSTACKHGHAGIVIDSPAEWRRLRDVVASGLSARVLLRVNPGLSLGGLDMAGESQFGLDVDQALSIAAECRTVRGTEFCGLHFYFGSQRLTPEPIVQLVQAATRVLEAFTQAGIKPGTVDLGLGCGVPYLEKDTPLDLAELRLRLSQLWQAPAWSGVQLWTEGGRALVGQSGFYVARVLERKVRGDAVFVFLDGGLNAHNPGIGVGRFFRSNPRLLFVRRNDREVPSEVADIVGNLCTSADSLGRKVRMPELEEGDLVVIPNSGAYCQTTALWGFNSQPLFSEAILTPSGDLSEIAPQPEVLITAAYPSDGLKSMPPAS
jgi:diaminopimelate decarboxylase